MNIVCFFCNWKYIIVKSNILLIFVLCMFSNLTSTPCTLFYLHGWHEDSYDNSSRLWLMVQSLYSFVNANFLVLLVSCNILYLDVADVAQLHFATRKTETSKTSQISKKYSQFRWNVSDHSQARQRQTPAMKCGRRRIFRHISSLLRLSPASKMVVNFHHAELFTRLF